MALLPRDLNNDPSSIEAYFDTSLNITWNADVLSEQTYNIDGWRLPSLNPQDPYSPANELANLFYSTLDNTMNPININTGPFIFPKKTFPVEYDHQNYDYLFITNVLSDVNDIEGGHWLFSFETGQATPSGGDYGLYLHWNVHDGDIGTHLPLPPSLSLLFVSLFFMAFIGRRRIK